MRRRIVVALDLLLVAGTATEKYGTSRKVDFADIFIRLPQKDRMIFLRDRLMLPFGGPAPVIEQLFEGGRSLRSSAH